MHHHAVAKIIAWSLISIIFGAIFFLVLHSAFSTPIADARNPAVFITRILLPIVLFCAFLATCGIHALCFGRRSFGLPTMCVASSTLFFFFSISMWSVVAFMAFALILCGWYLSIRSDYASRIRVQPIYSLASGLGTAMTLSLLAISVLAYSLFVHNLTTEEALRTAIRDSMTETSIQIMKTQVKGFSGDLTVDEFIANMIVGRVRANFIPDFQSIEEKETANNDQTIENLRRAIELQTGKPIPKEEFNNAINKEGTKTAEEGISRVITEQLGAAERQMIGQVRDELSKSLGISVKGTDTLRTVVSQLIEQRVISALNPYLRFIPVLFTVTLFLVLFFFSFLYRYLTRAFGLLLYWILRVSHFIKIIDVNVKAKRISID